MAASETLIPVEEYLKTVTEPDCEYIAGVIELRTPAELDHPVGKLHRWGGLRAEAPNGVCASFRRSA